MSKKKKGKKKGLKQPELIQGKNTKQPWLSKGKKK